MTPEQMNMEEKLAIQYSLGYQDGFLEAKTKYERPQGEWILNTNYTDNEDTWECSICGEPFTLTTGTPEDNLYNYCPKCGAKLIQVDRGEKE